MAILKNSQILRTISLILIAILFCRCSYGKVIYVDDDATGDNNGTNWINAYVYLQDALAEAGSITTEPVEVWVAQGTYTPDKGADQTPGDREATFQLINDVTLKGSYAGITGPDPNLRNIESYQTILSGDLLSNDIEVNGPCELLIEPTRSENSYHVVTCVIEETAILDGFTITAGNANVTPLRPYSIDGFIYDSYGNLSSNKYIFDVNPSTDQGGGMYNVSNLSVYNCTFSKNSALSGGGGVYNEGLPEINKEITFNNCYFKGNCANYGGGMCNSHTSYTDIRLTFCVFEGNYAQLLRIGGKGGGLCNFDSNPMLTNCIFVGNHAENSGGGIMNYYESNSILKNCIFWDNTNLWSNAFSQIAGSSSVSYSDIQGGWEGEVNINIDPLFANPGYWANVDDPNIATEPNDPNAVWIDGDCHLKSQAGRWDPVSESWVQDDVTSPCIDAGDPNSPIGHEPFPNGGIINMGAYGGTAEASKSPIGTSTYAFVSEQSMITQTGGFAGVNWTYTLTGQFQLTVDFGADKAWFSNVDAIATDDSTPDRRLDPNEVFNLTSLTGTIGQDGSIQFKGQAADGSDVLLDITLSDEPISLKGQTIPPPNSADFFIFNLDAVALRKYGGGTGEPDNSYLIYTAGQMNTIGTEPDDWDKHFKLMADIDLSGFSYDTALIAPDIDPCDPGFQGTSFTGVLDGNGHKISNLTITGEGYLGLFGQLETGAEIKNLGVTDVNITGSDYVGGFVGFSKGNISTSYCTGTISGDKRIGGITGRNWRNITACYSTATVTGNDNVGGISGGNYGSITNSYSTGAVTGNWDVGGIVGENYGTIAKCYSTGTVSGTTRAGGLVGSNWPDTGIVSGFWDVETSGLSTTDGGTGKTTAEMQTAGTFIEAGWDLMNETANGTEDIWWILEGLDYPRLWWQAE